MRLGDLDALMETITSNDYPVRGVMGSADRGMFTVGIQQAVDGQPTVEAAPVVHGKWIFLESGVYQCSVCKRETDMEQNKYEVYSYCPNCAAKMDL